MSSILKKILFIIIVSLTSFFSHAQFSSSTAVRTNDYFDDGGAPKSYYVNRIGDVLYGLIDSYTGETVTYTKTTTETTIDGAIIRKKGSEYFKRNCAYINPLWFGAIGSGSLSDTAANNAAFTKALAKGGHIIIPDGLFKLSKTLSLNPDYEYVFEGSGYNAYGAGSLKGTTLQWTTATNGIDIDNSTQAAEAAHRIEIKNFTMVGGNTALFGIRANYIHNSLIDNVWIVGFTKAGIAFDNCWGATFQYVVCAHNYLQGLVLSNRNNNVNIYKCTFNGNALKNGYSNLQLTGSPSYENLNVNIIGCDFSYAANTPVETITEAHGLAIAHSFGVNVIGNYCEAGIGVGRSTGYVGTNTQNIVVRGNYFQDRSFVFETTKNSAFVNNTYQRITPGYDNVAVIGMSDGLNGNEVYGNATIQDLDTAGIRYFGEVHSRSKLFVASLDRGNYATDSILVREWGSNEIKLIPPSTFQSVTDRDSTTNHNITARGAQFFDGDIQVEKSAGAKITQISHNGSISTQVVPIGLSNEWVIRNNATEMARFDSSFHLRLAIVSTGTAGDSLLSKKPSGEITKIEYPLISASSTVDFASTAAQNSSEQTVTVTGATVGMVASVNTNINPANTSWSAYVSATNTVTVRFNNYSSGAIDPASATFNIRVIK
jgi:hypothetical protein